MRFARPGTSLDPRSPATTPGVARLPLLKALTSIRFFAALHVALYHLVRPFSRWGVLAAAMSLGYSGVSFFFFLSGFILTYAHAKEYEQGKGNRQRFWVARLARVYPVYFLTMLLAGSARFSDFHPRIHILAFIADLLVLQSWSMRMVNFFNSGAWTLSCEAFFYFVFPFLIAAIRPRTRSQAIVGMAGFYLLAMLAPLVALRLYPNPASHESFALVPGDGFVFLISRLPLLALPEFLAGMSLGWFFVIFKPAQRASALLAITASVLLAIALLFGNRLPYIALHNGLLIPLYAMLLLGLAQPNWFSKLLSGSFMVLLGEASFALYLLHIIVGDYAEAHGFPRTITTACWLLALVIPASIATHILIERPCRRYILRWWASRHPSQLSVSSQ